MPEKQTKTNKHFLKAGAVSSMIAGSLFSLSVVIAQVLALTMTSGTWAYNSIYPWDTVENYIQSSVLSIVVCAMLFGIATLPIGLTHGWLYSKFATTLTSHKQTPQVWTISGAFIGFLIPTLDLLRWGNLTAVYFLNQYNPHFGGLSHSGFMFLIIFVGCTISGGIGGYIGGKKLQMALKLANADVYGK